MDLKLFSSWSSVGLVQYIRACAHLHSWVRCGRWGASWGCPRAWSDPPASPPALLMAKSARSPGSPKSIQENNGWDLLSRADVDHHHRTHHDAAVLRAARNNVVVVGAKLDVQHGPRMAAHRRVGHVDPTSLHTSKLVGKPSYHFWLGSATRKVLKILARKLFLLSDMKFSWHVCYE